MALQTADGLKPVKSITLYGNPEPIVFATVEGQQVRVSFQAFFDYVTVKVIKPGETNIFTHHGPFLVQWK